jgi:hypothetical protein
MQFYFQTKDFFESILIFLNRAKFCYSILKKNWQEFFYFLIHVYCKVYSKKSHNILMKMLVSFLGPKWCLSSRNDNSVMIYEKGVAVGESEMLEI